FPPVLNGLSQAVLSWVLVNGHCPIYGDGLTYDVTGPWAAEPRHCRGDLLRTSGAADRYVLCDFGIGLLVSIDDIPVDLCIDQARVHGIHIDAFLDVLESRRPRQADHAVFGRNIAADTGVSGQCTDRCIVHDGTASLLRHLAEFVFHTAPDTAQIDADHAIPFFA